MNACDLKTVMRLLWEQHVEWTRMVIISIAASLPDREFTIQRLLRNPSDMAEALQPFYGDQAASTFRRLMTDHLTIAVELVDAAKAGNSKAVAKAERKWYANADQIAAFLAGINPFWPYDVLRAMLHEHLQLTENEAVLRLQKKYQADIIEYDQVEQQALMMADALTSGIIQQFPLSFVDY